MSQRKLPDFRAEIESHIALEAERLKQEGLSDADAWDAARRRFGNITATEERFYERTSRPWIEHFAQDVRYAARLSPGWNVVMTGRDAAERVETLYVSASFFPMLGVKATIGREFLPDDDRPNARPVVILAHEFWQRRFGGDRSLMGQNLNLDSG